MKEKKTNQFSKCLDKPLPETISLGASKGMGQPGSVSRETRNVLKPRAWSSWERGGQGWGRVSASADRVQTGGEDAWSNGEGPASIGLSGRRRAPLMERETQQGAEKRGPGAGAIRLAVLV